MLSLTRSSVHPPSGHGLRSLGKVLVADTTKDDCLLEHDFGKLADVGSCSDIFRSHKLFSFQEPIKQNGEPIITPRRKSDSARHLATIFHVCQKHLDAIRSQEKACVSVLNFALLYETGLSGV